MFIEDFADRIDHASDGVEDPAEAFAICARLFFHKVTVAPKWTKFLLRTVLPMNPAPTSYPDRGARDFMRGVMTGRFKVADPVVALASVLGSGMALAQAIHLGVLSEGAIEKGAAQLLVILGLDRAEATEVVARPLPESAQAYWEELSEAPSGELVDPRL